MEKYPWILIKNPPYLFLFTGKYIRITTYKEATKGKFKNTVKFLNIWKQKIAVIILKFE